MQLHCVISLHKKKNEKKKIRKKKEEEKKEEEKNKEGEEKKEEKIKEAVKKGEEEEKEKEEEEEEGRKKNKKGERRRKRGERRRKIWKVLGSATEWVGRGSIGWAGAVSGGQGQYRLFHYPCQIFGISQKLFKMLFWLVEPKKLIQFD